MPATRVVNINHEDCDIYIGRPSRWGNPFQIGVYGDRQRVLLLYAEWIRRQPDLLRALPTLRGKRLGCHCAPLPCHGDVLISLLRELDKQNHEQPPRH